MKHLFDNFGLEQLIINEKYVCLKTVVKLVGRWVEVKVVLWIAYSNQQNQLRSISKIAGSI
jgi:hypothetical protein